MTNYRIKLKYQGGTFTHRVAGGVIKVLETSREVDLTSFAQHPEFMEYLEEIPTSLPYRGVEPEVGGSSDAPARTKPHRNGK